MNMNLISRFFLLGALALAAGCETTNSIPYNPSTENVIAIQSAVAADEDRMRLGSFAMAQGVDEEPLCRLMGPVRVAPGKSMPDYIRDAFQQELFLAGVYDSKAGILISGSINALE